MNILQLWLNGLLRDLKVCKNFYTNVTDWQCKCIGDQTTIPSHEQEADAAKAKKPKLHTKPTKSASQKSSGKLTAKQISHLWSPSKSGDVSDDDDNEDEEDETAKMEAALANAAAAIKRRAEKALAAEVKPPLSGDDADADEAEAKAGDKDDSEAEDNTEAGDNGGNKEEEDETAKVQAALDNAAATLKCKEEAAKNREEKLTKEVKEKMRGPQGRKRSAEDVSGEVAPPPKRRGQPEPQRGAPLPIQAGHSSRAGKGENTKNYELADGKYTGK